MDNECNYIVEDIYNNNDDDDNDYHPYYHL